MTKFEQKGHVLEKAVYDYQNCIKEYGEKHSQTLRAKINLNKADREYRTALFGYYIPRTPEEEIKLWSFSI